MVTSENNKRIAKNTLLLYFRMLFTMLISLYTSRIVLNALGVIDFGIYNVVGGVVTMFSVLSGSLSSAISRFITFELGRSNFDRLKEIFSTAVIIQVVLSIIVITLGETVGMWFLNYKMNIPAERMIAANWVFQFSILTFVVNLISVPYNASIIAHERMSAFAYISILEVAGKLIVAYFISISPIDKLIFYAVLICVIALTIRMVYGLYCKRYFDECTFHFVWRPQLLKQMFGFAGWNFIGSSSAILRDQGGNIIINLFCGPVVNAARGIAYQVNAAVYGFVTNFMMAINPQITKSYSSGNTEYMMTLLFQGGRFAFYLLLLLSLPIISNVNYVLSLWLGVIPEYTNVFICLILVFALSESISQPLITAQLATGKIRNYQFMVGGMQMLNFPIAYILLRCGCSPEAVFLLAIVISQCCLAIRLYMLHIMIQLDVRKYIKQVYLNVWLVGGLSALPVLCLSSFQEDSWMAFVINCFVCVICSLSFIFYVGCNCSERQLVLDKCRQVLVKLVKR